MAPVSRRARLATGALIAALAASPVLAQRDYPTRPVRLIAPLAPGGGPDTVARILGGRLSEILGQQVLVDNRPGGGSGPATTAQLAGEIAISFVNPIPTMPHVKAGKLRMLAVSSRVCLRA